MRKFATLTFLALVGSAASFAASFTTGFINCGPTQSVNVPPSTGTLDFTCAAVTAASLGGIDISGYQLILNGGYTGGTANQTNAITEVFTPTGGAPGSVVYSITVPNWNFTATAANTNANTVASDCVGGGPNCGPIVASGFAPVVSLGPLTFHDVLNLTQGSVSDMSGSVKIAYTYDTASTSGVPEPVSMVLFGSGLLCVSLIGRKKFARK